MCDAHNINVYCSIFWYFRIQWYYVIIMENNLTVWGQAYQSLELSILPDLCPVSSGMVKSRYKAWKLDNEDTRLEA